MVSRLDTFDREEIMLEFFREKARWFGLVALIAIVAFMIGPMIATMFGL